MKLKQNGSFGQLLQTLSDFLRNRKQWVVLNDQNLSWTSVHAGVPQGSYINDLSDNLTSNTKLCADDTSLFSVVHGASTSAKELNDDLKKLVNGLSNGK